MRKRRKTFVLALVSVAAMLAVAAAGAFAQEPDDETEGARGGPARGRHLVGGEVLRIEADTITLKTLGGEEKAVKVNEDTRYHKPPDGEATLADVKTGEKIGVALDTQAPEGQLLAREVLIGEPPRGPGGPGGRRPIIGEVTAVNGDTITINGPDGSKEVKVPAIEVGSRLGVIAAEDGTVKGLLYNVPEKPSVRQEEAPAAE